jgi:UDPglucose--hexose-1-phosphate uridylyltransferase
MLNLQEQAHRRWNPLTREWVVVSPHRTQRPWQGQMEKPAVEVQPEYDPSCYLCPGNPRAGGVRNPAYTSTFVFDNDFAALKPGTVAERFEQDGLLIAESEPGICRVVCFSPKHNLTIAGMDPADLRTVVDTWAEQYTSLGSDPNIGYVQIFENRGAMMGASNPHPHCQVWATASIPQEPAKELGAQRSYLKSHGSCLLCDYVALEARQQVRIVLQNEGFVAMVPFWAVWPFELLVCSRRHIGSMNDFSPEDARSLSAVLHQVTSTYDKVFGVPFPYSMGFHQSPCDGEQHPEWHFHAHFYPPLLRSATIRKFMVGFEMLGMPQRDITAESAAERLRDIART